MAIKKSDLYSSLWASCDELRGGMDASQYKDYVLTLLFVKYVSDKYANKTDSLIEVPKGASFDDMVALKGQDDIGDRINKEILRPLFAANGLEGTIELVDFNDDDKLGTGKERVDTLSKLIAIFENPGLNFKNNRAEDDDVLGDAYEFLMRHFATESGKSKGQFYTPAEVSRVLAKIIDVNKADKPSYTVYDPTCGSGSLLLKVADEAPHGLTIYGQEKDIATKGLAIMNMWLHGYPEAEIYGKNTIASPQTLESDGSLKRFDFVVANPPFSVKNWSSGIDPVNDEYNRFRGYGIPPEKNGDYAFLLHIVASLKSTGKGAVILPHGVLFRGNAEGEIRKNLIERKIIKGIIGLPANLFYGTGIPACIIVIDKEHAEERKGIFMIDASKGYTKDGNKNRLREQDLHKIVDVFNNQQRVDKYSQMVSWEDVEKNEYNLNIPRYIDTQEPEDIQDLDAHLNGGFPNRDIDNLQSYWDAFPTLRSDLFAPLRDGYSELKVASSAIKETIFAHPEFEGFQQQMQEVFADFKEKNYHVLVGINPENSPKKFVREVAESLLETYTNKPLVSRYKVYQHLLNYWNETMKDDVYMLIEDGWIAKVDRIVEKNKRGKEVDKGWTCELLPKEYIIRAYLGEESQMLKEKESQQEALQGNILEVEEEHGVEGGLLEGAANDKGKISKTTLSKFIKEIKGDASEKEAYVVAQELLKKFNKEANLKKEIKAQEDSLDSLSMQQYGKLSEVDVKRLVVEEKWLATIKGDIDREVDAVTQRLSTRIKELSERYGHTLGSIEEGVDEAEAQVKRHLAKMGLVWN